MDFIEFWHNECNKTFKLNEFKSFACANVFHFGIVENWPFKYGLNVKRLDVNFIENGQRVEQIHVKTKNKLNRPTLTKAIRDWLGKNVFFCQTT